MNLFKHLNEIDKCKDIVRYFMFTFMNWGKGSYTQEIGHNGYIMTLQYTDGTRGTEYFVEIEKLVPGMFKPGQISQGRQQLMAFRYYKHEDGILFLGHGEWPEVLSVLEDFLVRQCAVIGPMQEAIIENIKGPTKETQTLHIKFEALYGSVEYNCTDGWNCMLFTGEPGFNPEKILIDSAPMNRQPLPSARIKGDLKKLAGMVWDFHKEYTVSVQQAEKAVGELIKELSPNVPFVRFKLDFDYKDSILSIAIGEDGKGILGCHRGPMSTKSLIVAAFDKEDLRLTKSATMGRTPSVVNRYITEVLEEVRAYGLANCKVYKHDLIQE